MHLKTIMRGVIGFTGLPKVAMEQMVKNTSLQD